MVNSLLQKDNELFSHIYHFLPTDFTLIFFDTVTNFFVSVTFVCLIGVALYLSGKKRLILPFFISLALTFGLQQLLSLFIGRLRPFVTLPDRPYLGTIIPGGFSFPSGHATVAFFIACFLIFMFKPHRIIKIFLYSAAFLVAFSRVYLGAHYPLDILFGGILGCITAYTSIHLYTSYIQKK